ncbi:hypothetical protein [Ruminococcus sp.]|uniref:hypothetical protein n=1 Tax=Ruminococcus sp. TaxID=41978 RepID=UPI0025F7D973|nr:hypothetical protein [Ruminococcus sp.]MBQ8965682.1 hypothetical protein [Ruminococcus sp.]
MKKPKFMKDYYGFDRLFFVITGICVLAAVLGYTVLWRVPHIDSGAVVAMALFGMLLNLSRVFSKDIRRRENENLRFTNWLNRVTGKNGNDGKRSRKAEQQANVLGSRKVYRCSCGQELVPYEGRGRQMLVCPRCGSRNIIEK